MDGTILNKKLKIEEKLAQLNEIAQKVDDMPTFTSDDRAFLEELPGFPTTDGKKVLTATTESGETSLAYEEVESGDSYSAGDYISISNNVISVNKFLPYSGVTYEIVTNSTGGNDASIKVIKRENGDIVSQDIYYYNSTPTPVVIDNRFSVQYSNGWIFTTIIASAEHQVGYRKTWSYLDVVDFTESYDNTDQQLVVMETINAIKQAIIGASDFADAQSRLSALTSNRSISEPNLKKRTTKSKK